VFPGDFACVSAALLRNSLLISLLAGIAVVEIRNGHAVRVMQLSQGPT
jgi:hypothetical protein